MANPTVLHGVDSWGATIAARPSRGHNGQRWYDLATGTCWFYDESTSAWWPDGYLYVDYDFAVHGGAIGAIVLATDVIPDNAIIFEGFYDVITTFTTAGADAGTIALHVQSANDLVTAVAVSNGANPWDAGIKAIIPVGAAANAIKTTAVRSVTLTIATQVVTAGKLRLALRVLKSL